MAETTFQLTDAQAAAPGVLIGLIGLTGVHKRPEQGADMVLDLLPAEHVLEGPFCVRISPDGSVKAISDSEAGMAEGERG